MKKYAFFLPQFHEIKENNKWWGKGFTEWVNVKKAKPLYKNHIQPKVPLDGCYNLLEKKTVINQTNLMKEYGIDGLIYYHYYFKGKKLLEKPAENLLKWNDIEQNFFFCWANHSWIKSWEGTQEMLLEQKYGNEKDWAKHFDYLLPFFKDNRYVKKDNKPLFMIFKGYFEEKIDILNYFDRRCKENGFDGIFVINTCFEQKEMEKYELEKTEYQKAQFLREPNYSLSLYRNFFVKVKEKILKITRISYFRKYNGNKFLTLATKKMIKKDNVIHGLFFEWDNTPRHKKRGYVITPVNKKIFCKYIKKVEDEEFIFINAWNEWAEGMVLEPTLENKYKYLEWIKEFDKKL